MIWVPEHYDIESNEKADKYTAFGSFLDETMTCKDVLTPLVVVANKIDDWALRKITSRWSAIETCAISRTLWLLRSHIRTHVLLPFDRVLIRFLAGIIIGH